MRGAVRIAGCAAGAEGRLDEMTQGPTKCTCILRRRRRIRMLPQCPAKRSRQAQGIDFGLWCSTP